MDNVWTRGRLVFFGTSALVITAVLVWGGPILLPFLVAAILAYVLTPLVQWCENRGLSRGLAVGLVGLVALGLVGGASAVALPRLYHELSHVRKGLPSLGRELGATWGPWLEKTSEEFFGAEPESPEDAPQFVVAPLEGGGYAITITQPVDLVQTGAQHWELQPRTAAEPFEFSRWAQHLVDGSLDYVRQNTREVLRFGGALLSSASRGVLLFFMTLMCTGYLMYTRESIGQFWALLPPEPARAGFQRWLARVDRGLSGVVRGQLIICGVNGALSAVGFALFDLKYWPLMAVVAAVFSLIPIFGAILSSIPAVIIALTQSGWTALWVLLWILGIHQVEANVLNPKIMGDSAKLHPVLVIFALVLGEHSYGLEGALFALPVLSIAQSTFLHFRAELLPESVPPSSRRPALSGAQPALDGRPDASSPGRTA